MSYFRRARTAGGCYFFTLVSFRRRPILCDEPIRHALRAAVQSTREKYPFNIDAWVLLPDHLHCIWTLPEGDADYAKRWSIIKRKVSVVCGDCYHMKGLLSDAQRRRRQSTLWQRRYWEHLIRDDEDYAQHMDYIHYNPVHHGLSDSPFQWPYSTLGRHVRAGLYPADWTLDDGGFDGDGFGE